MPRHLATAATVGLLLLLVPVAATSPTHAAACVAVAGLLMVVAAVGPDRSGAFFVILALFLAPMESVRPGAGSIVTFSDLAFAVGFALLAPRMLHRRNTIPVPFVVGGFLLLVVSLLASALSPDPLLSLTTMPRLVAAVVVLPLLFLQWRPSWRTLDVLAAAYVAGHLVSTAAGVLEGAESNGRYFGLTTHPNYLGHCAVLAFALLLHLRLRVPRGWRWVVWGAFAGCLLSVQMSGSRAAIVAVVLVLLVYPVVERSAVTAYLIVAGSVLAATFGNFLLERAGKGSALSRLQGDATSRTSDRTREDVLSDALDRFLASPLLGDGFHETPLGAHNIYLQVAVVTGLLGLIAFLLIMWSMVVPLFRTAHPMHRLGFAALTYASLGMITNSLWDRFVWAVMAIGFVATLRPSADHVDQDPEPASLAPAGRTG